MRVILFVTAALILVSVSHSKTKCTAANYCRSCELAKDECIDCYNKGTDAKSLKDKKCTTALPTAVKVTDCAYHLKTTTSTATLTVHTCTECKTNYWKELDMVGSVGNVPKSVKCLAKPSQAKCTAVDNCEQGTCVVKTKTPAVTVAQGCMFCKEGFLGKVSSKEGTIFLGTTLCPKILDADKIKNCARHWWNDTKVTCRLCAKDHALAKDHLSCKSYTTDANCLRLHTDNTNCMECKNDYYWNGEKCGTGSTAADAKKKSANVGVTSMTLLAVVLALLNFLF